MDKVYCADVWFSTGLEQAAHALTKGTNKDDIHVEGREAEGWESIKMSFRGRPGRLGLVGGLYIIGQNSNTLKARLAELRQLKIKPYDFDDPKLTGEELYARAMASILGSRKFRNRSHHKAVSARGGEGKAREAAKRRGEIAVKWLLQNIVRAEFMTWDQKTELLTKPGEKRPKISEASLRRHYL